LKIYDSKDDENIEVKFLRYQNVATREPETTSKEKILQYLQ